LMVRGGGSGTDVPSAEALLFPAKGVYDEFTDVYGMPILQWDGWAMDSRHN
jgi:hypothetical protein